MSKFGFDLNEYASDGGSKDYSPLPKGEYTIKCIEAELKDTKSGGQMIAAKFEVARGEHTGRFIWSNYNIHNNSEKAQQIGREQLSAWAKAAGKPNANSVDELLERPFKCSLDIEAGTNGYADKNRIVGYILSEVKAPQKSSLADMKEDDPDDAVTSGKTSKKKNPWD
jgi:hypothetical protein